jgi:glycosyltransferase involved in cell wall biosynthesis
MKAKRSIVIVQYAGDYAEAYRRLAGGGKENYYAQRYSIEVVADLVRDDTAVAVICCTSEADEDTVLANGVRSINLRSPGGVDEQRVWRAVQSCAPTHLCLRSPLTRVLRAALRSGSIASVLLTLADSFEERSWRARLRAWRLKRLLNHPKVLAVGNHGVSASRSLRRIGVLPSKIIPWDWPHQVSPRQSPVKSAPAAKTWSIFFVGLLIESKGVGDVIRAVRRLADDGIRVTLDCAGRGDVARFEALARELDVAAQVTFLGMLPHSEVVPAMKRADLVVIPSRHDYPEGFPMTVYEALSSRTPIIASDHPMYAPHLSRTAAAAIFPAADCVAIAEAVKSLMADPAAYASLSAASADSWDQLQLPVTWGELLTEWLRDRPAEGYAPLKHALSAAH